MRTVLLILGTRPEAIKLAPLILHLRSRLAEFRTIVCVTAQHRGMLDQVLRIFRIEPDYDLDLMLPGQTLFQSTSRILAGLEPVFDAVRPDIAIVQGDTTTTLCGALAGFYKDVPVGHVEAGLRSGDTRQPFPEEMNRVLASRVTTLHFAATAWAADNLRKEGVPSSSILVTGNTGIDAILHVRDELERGVLTAEHCPAVDPAKKLIVVTAHRRESFGPGFDRICTALAHLSKRDDGPDCIYPVHPNPNVQGAVDRHLRVCRNVLLHRASGLCLVRGPDAPGVPAHHRFGRHSGRGPFSRQAHIGVTRKDRAAGSGLRRAPCGWSARTKTDRARGVNAVCSTFRTPIGPWLAATILTGTAMRAHALPMRCATSGSIQQERVEEQLESEIALRAILGTHAEEDDVARAVSCVDQRGLAFDALLSQ